MKKASDFYLNSAWLPLAVFLLLTLGYIKAGFEGFYVFMGLYSLFLLGMLAAGIYQVKKGSFYKGFTNCFFFMLFCVIGIVFTGLWLDAQATRGERSRPQWEVSDTVTK